MIQPGNNVDMIVQWQIQISRHPHSGEHSAFSVLSAQTGIRGLGTTILAQATTELDFPKTDGYMWYKPPLSSREGKAQSLPQPHFSVKTTEQKPSRVWTQLYWLISDTNYSHLEREILVEKIPLSDCL